MKYLVYYMFFAFGVVILSMPFLSWFLSQERLMEKMFSVTETMGDMYTSQEEKWVNLTDIPLRIPSGFQISYFATWLSWPRVLAFDSFERLVVSLTRSGEVAVFENMSISGWVKKPKILLSGLSRPHGLLFVSNGSGTWLYVAETDRVTRYEYNPILATAENPIKVLDLPGGGRHFTRTLLLLPDQRILVSIGSSCDTCIEKDNRRAAMLGMNLDGTQTSLYATWLRNTVFLRLHPVTHEVWGTEMGRDYLGDNLPPDEVNIIREWWFYGWPYCYGQRVADRIYGSADIDHEICNASEPSRINIPAHSAPLGLVFIPENWPPWYEGNLLVSYHGSWNRSVPTGYKVVQMWFDRAWKYVGTKDFITGWRSEGRTHGRPVDLLFSSGGVLYISDDDRSVIYQVTVKKEL